MIFRQVIHEDLGCASYLVGDAAAGMAVVVDPRLDVGEYLRLAAYLGVAITHVLETHTHADHVSGHGALASATGAAIHVHRASGAAHGHHPIDDGWELHLGTVTVRALHTPGHRPEHTAFTLTDARRGDEPWAVLTGDTLFVGDVARPDLAVDREEGARALHRSLHERLLALPDTCEVWPGHLGGSMCGGPGMDAKTSSTIGYERRNQPLLQVRDPDEFVRRATAALGAQPPNFRHVVALNRGPLLPAPTRPAPRAPAEVRDAQAAGALVVDVRAESAFDDGHVPGAVCVPAGRPGFGSKLGWLAGPDRPLVFVAADPDEAHRAALLAAAAGLRRHAGTLAGGVGAWRSAGLPVATMERLSVPDLHARWSGGGIQVLDVRERADWEALHIPGSVQRAFREIDGIPEGLDGGAPLAVICASGPRAAVAASLLQAAGARAVARVGDGGVPLWARLGLPLAGDAAPAPGAVAAGRA